MRNFRSILPVALVAGASAALAPNAEAQSRQPWSAQGSALYTVQDFGENAGNVGGLGIEVQARRTFPAWSIGAGVQYSQHSSGGDDLGITGFFLEPRRVLGTAVGPFAPYLAGRLVYLRGNLSSDLLEGEGSTGGFAIGAGGGFIYGLTRTINLDVGGAVLHQSFGDFTLDNEIESSVSLPSAIGYVIKAGLSIGFERSAESGFKARRR